MKLIIPMAGRGTRVRPHSHVTPKPLLHVRGKSIVARIVDLFSRVLPDPPDEGVFILGPDFGQEIRDQLTTICEERGMSASFAIQHEAKGTAHAVGSAEEYLHGDGIVVFADTLFDMDDTVDLGDSDVIAWVKEVEDPSRFGVAVRDGEEITRFVEKPDKPISNEALIGIYYVSELSDLKKAIDYLLENNIIGKGDEYQLTDAFDRLLQDGKQFTTASATEWLDCGTIPALLGTTKHMIAKEAENNGTPEGSVEDSIIREPVYIGPGAEISNSVIGPYASVEAGAKVENSVVEGSILFSEARVEESALQDSLVGQHAHVRGQAGHINIGDHSQIGREL